MAKSAFLKFLLVLFHEPKTYSNSWLGVGICCPNQCFCKLGGTAIESDDKALCNNEDINGVGATDPNA